MRGRRATKKFGGKRYSYMITFRTKTEANKYASAERRGGYNARISHTTSGYDVWVRKSKSIWY